MLKLAHRGASGYAPENTIAAFRKAMELGADGVELDVHRCKTGELVVIHDDTVDRVTGTRGKVAEMTLADLRALHVANRERIPTLAEALLALAGAYCFVEIKHDDVALPAAEQILRHQKDNVSAAKCWLISFRHDALKNAFQKYPALWVGASFERLTLTSLHEVHAWGARAILPHYQSFGEREVKEAHALGLKVICWTVNEPADISRLRALGVDGIISDYPDRLQEG